MSHKRLTDCPREVVHLSTGGIRKKVAGRAGEAQAYRWLSSHADIYDTVQDDGAVVEIVKGQLNLTAASAFRAVDLEDWDTVLSCVETLHGQAKLLAGIVHKQGSLFAVLQAPPSELTAAWAALQVTIENVAIQPTILCLESARPAAGTALLQLMQRPAPPARPDQVAVSVSQHNWAGDRFGAHLSVSMAGIECPCPDLRRTNHSVLSFAVAANDVATLLQSPRAVHASAVDWFGATEGARRTALGRHAVGGGGTEYKDTVFSAPTTSTWHVQATKLYVRAGALELCLENVGPSGSATDHGSYELVRNHRGMGDVWRARRPQTWRVHLLAPLSGEVTKALLLLLQT